MKHAIPERLNTFCLARERLVALRDERFPGASAFCTLDSRNHASGNIADEIRLCLVSQPLHGGLFLVSSVIVADDSLNAAFDRIEAEHAEMIRADQTASA